MKIGVIGSGRIGSTVGRLLADAGHEIMFSSRHPEALDALVAKVGPRATRASITEAARFGEVLLVSVPFNALPALGQELADIIEGKVVLETGNPYPERDGKIAEELIASGRGTAPSHASTCRALAWCGPLTRSGIRPWPRRRIGLTRRLEFRSLRMIAKPSKSPRVWCETRVSIRSRWAASMRRSGSTSARPSITPE